MSTNPVTFINVLDTDTDRQDELVALIADTLDQIISKRPGFVEARLYVSANGGRVINEVTWESADAVAATQADPAVADAAAKVAKLATATPGVYVLRAQHGA